MAPWELAEQPIYWLEAIEHSMSIEADVQSKRETVSEQRSQARARRRGKGKRK